MVEQAQALENQGKAKDILVVGQAVVGTVAREAVVGIVAQAVVAAVGIVEAQVVALVEVVVGEQVVCSPLLRPQCKPPQV